MDKQIFRRAKKMFNFEFNVMGYIISVSCKLKYKVVFYPVRYWRLNRWEKDPLDPWNGYEWRIFTPILWIGKIMESKL